MKLGVSDQNVKTISFDFSDVKGSSGVINQTVDQFGVLDYLVSNHAAMLNGPFLAIPRQQEPAYIEKIFRVNLFSQIELAIHALPHIEASKGHMFFTSSMAGEAPFYTMSIYCSTKHGMNGFFYSLQQELLARESAASLTIGAFGFIITKQISEMLADEPVDITRGAGDAKECARGMMESYVTRPLTMSYPKLAGYLNRILWYFYSNYHDLIIKNSKPPGSLGTGYQGTLERLARMEEKAKKLKFQQGYYGPDE